jgi:hypothetical protein
MKFERRALIAAFAILVLTVAGIGWQIEQIEQKNLEANCSTMAFGTVLLHNSLSEELAANRLSAEIYQETLGRAAAEFDAICSDVDRDGVGGPDDLIVREG